jgi:hypothetical protein
LASALPLKRNFPPFTSAPPTPGINSEAPINAAGFHSFLMPADVVVTHAYSRLDRNGSRCSKPISLSGYVGSSGT